MTIVVSSMSSVYLPIRRLFFFFCLRGVLGFSLFPFLGLF